MSDDTTRYYRADPGTLASEAAPWWMAPADDEVNELRASLVALAERLEVEGFVGHEECPIPGEPGWPKDACEDCRALTVAHRIKEATVTA